jgi:L-asparaginase / beta-aspartyl-peptidase
MNKYAIAIHGGAGTINKDLVTPRQEEEYKTGLHAALEAGDKILGKGGRALDAVEAAIIVLEDNPLFNAGRGAVFTHEGKHEMDAALMSGEDLSAGAVTGVSNIRNPVKLARAIMEHSGHVLLAGEGANEFAKKMELDFMPDEYFFSQYRYDQLQLIKDTGVVKLDHSRSDVKTEKKFGTVGAVALDVHGNLAAGTSTGGLTNKRYGRVGDTPIIGAGTYANNKTCAISCTGVGEYFIRVVAAYDISCLMEYKGLSLAEACTEVVQNKLLKLGGEGGLIAMDALGNIEFPFNSEGMYRGMKKEDGDFWVAIYNDEKGV